jgi:ornithine cyclodeaminase/alanine dehydrogenase-like protein (mu-crystallin family)
VSVLLLTEADVRRVLTMPMALEAVEDGLRRLALDEAENVPRSRCRTDHVMLHVMSAAVKGVGYLGYKVYTTTRGGARFHIGLFDGRTGELLALIEADYLGQVRTGAASGVATKYLAKPDAAAVGVYGAGKQARTQVQAVCAVRPVKRVSVHSRSEENRCRFAEEMSRACGVEVVPVDRPELAAQHQDVIITATNATEPILRGEWVEDGAHLNVIGSNFLSKSEVDVATVRRANLVVVDSKEQAKIEAGDLSRAVDAGALHWSAVAELGSVLVAKARGRGGPADVTLFKSVGLAVEDVATAARVYAAAKEQGVGRMIDW